MYKFQSVISGHNFFCNNQKEQLIIIVIQRSYYEKFYLLKSKLSSEQNGKLKTIWHFSKPRKYFCYRALKASLPMAGRLTRIVSSPPRLHVKKKNPK